MPRPAATPADREQPRVYPPSVVAEGEARRGRGVGAFCFVAAALSWAQGPGSKPHQRMGRRRPRRNVFVGQALSSPTFATRAPLPARSALGSWTVETGRPSSERDLVAPWAVRAVGAGAVVTATFRRAPSSRAIRRSSAGRASAARPRARRPPARGRCRPATASGPCLVEPRPRACGSTRRSERARRLRAPRRAAAADCAYSGDACTRPAIDQTPAAVDVGGMKVRR